ncbi:MAG: DUF3006 domain-containing protein [Clostridia bacterium]|nr:DUF3006 domain-containing protein [Clostridia bacterium]
MRVIIDRFEENIAVCELENGKFIDVPKCLFPDSSEGDIFEIKKISSETEIRKVKISKLADELWED